MPNKPPGGWKIFIPTTTDILGHSRGMFYFKSQFLIKMVNTDRCWQTKKQNWDTKINEVPAWWSNENHYILNYCKFANIELEERKNIQNVNFRFCPKLGRGLKEGLEIPTRVNRFLQKRICDLKWCISHETWK